MARRLDRYRYALMFLWTSGWAAHGFLGTHWVSHITDWDQLRFGGKALFGIELFYQQPPLHIYADYPMLQAGPPAVFVDGLAQLLLGRHGGYHGDEAVLAVMVGLGLLTVLGLERLASLVAPTRRGVVLALAVPLLAAWGQMFGFWGHVEDAAAITAVVWAAVIVARGNGWTVGALLGLAVCCKPWAVIITPILLALPASRQRFHAVALTVLVATAPWLPFFAADPRTIRLGDRLWPVSPDSPMHLLFSDWVLSPRGLRAPQLALGLLVAATLVWRGRWLAAPLAAFAVKVALDPGQFGYYGVGPLVAAVIADMAGRRRFPWWSAATLLVEFVIPFWDDGTVAAAARLVWCLVVLVAMAIAAMSGGPVGPRAAPLADAVDERPGESASVDLSRQ